MLALGIAGQQDAVSLSRSRCCRESAARVGVGDVGHQLGCREILGRKRWTNFK